MDGHILVGRYGGSSGQRNCRSLDNGHEEEHAANTQASMYSLPGSCAGFLHYDDNMRLWLTQPPHAGGLNRMSQAPPAPLPPTPKLPRLTDCLYALHTAVTNPSMPGMHGAQQREASTLPSRLGWKEHVPVAEHSPGTLNVAEGQNQNWYGP
ncbi:Hypothetical predicted protein [Xyrichtys novacula]|uniref:Uncharacterized protein n=1 Tax=Xyrichtys novacula TaxID=13765 RepID=A0AAV1FWS7_XYRNO|nr:Hypothetical predicted protein [Xyrichtys novacula]